MRIIKKQGIMQLPTNITYGGIDYSIEATLSYKFRMKGNNAKFEVILTEANITGPQPQDKVEQALISFMLFSPEYAKIFYNKAYTKFFKEVYPTWYKDIK